MRVLLATDELVLGEFSGQPDDPLWTSPNTIGDLPHVVWPFTTVEIIRPRAGRVCADSNGVLLYDAGTEYRRRPVSPAGDRSVFIALHPQLLERLTGRFTRKRAGQFPVGHLPLAAGGWLRMKTALSAGLACHDAMRLDELALTLSAPSLKRYRNNERLGRTLVAAFASVSKTLDDCSAMR